jgi:oxygen-independent coproporphyrinogen-3 oxidase
MGVNLDKYYADTSNEALQYAFKERFMSASAKPAAVGKEEIEKEYKKVLQTNSNGCVVYIHIPFCQYRCAFCGFSGVPVTKEEGKNYIDALIKEIELISEYNYVSKTPVLAVYLGGGTPSAVEPEFLNLLLGKVKKHLNLANDCEITLEGRIHDFEGQRGKDFVDAGFSRFSIGVQTFDTQIRRSLGRRSEKEKVIEILSKLVSYNEAAVIIDIIYGLPGQSAEMFLEDLKIAGAAGVDGLDTYLLRVFENSPLKKAIMSGSLAETPGINLQGVFYKAALDYLTFNKWRQISLSHYAKTDRERNVYNPWVKKKGGCIAIGAGAGGSIDGWSFYRAPAAQRYIENIKLGKFFPDSLSAPRADRIIVNKIAEQTEKGYLNKDEIFKLKDGLKEKFEPFIKNWEEAKLITQDSKYINFTAAGKFWASNIVAAAIDICTQEK